jgi:hypothetical protein
VAIETERQMPPRRIADVDRQALQFQLLQHRHQAPGDDVVVQDVHRPDQHAQLLQRRGAQHLAVVGCQLPLDRHRRHRTIAREAQLVRLRLEVVDQQPVAGQLVGRVRCAVALQVLR